MWKGVVREIMDTRTRIWIVSNNEYILFYNLAVDAVSVRQDMLTYALVYRKSWRRFFCPSGAIDTCSDGGGAFPIGSRQGGTLSLWLRENGIAIRLYGSVVVCRVWHRTVLPILLYIHGQAPGTVLTPPASTWLRRHHPPTTCLPA